MKPSAPTTSINCVERLQRSGIRASVDLIVLDPGIPGASCWPTAVWRVLVAKSEVARASELIRAT